MNLIYSIIDPLPPKKFQKRKKGVAINRATAILSWIFQSRRESIRFHETFPRRGIKITGKEGGERAKSSPLPFSGSLSSEKENLEKWKGVRSTKKGEREGEERDGRKRF